jgi:alpha-glucosidase
LKATKRLLISQANNLYKNYMKDIQYFSLKKYLLLIFIFPVHFVNAQLKEWKAVSPNQTLQIILSNENGKLSYKISSAGDVIIKPSQLGIERNDETFSDNLSFVKTSSKKIDEHYTLKIGKQKENHAVANETSIAFKNTNGAIINIDLRAYNDGVAFRYRFEGVAKKVIINKELTAFTVGKEGNTWIQNYDMPAQWNPSYESPYMNGISIGTTGKDSSGWAFPALFKTNNHWLLITESNVDNNYCGTHLQQHCENGVYKIAFPMPGEANNLGSIYPTATQPFTTPWRVIITGKNLGTIVESNLVYHLADKNKIGDDSWVKPGRSSWSWWSDHPSSKNFNALKKYVDLSKDMGWEYSLVDANWNIMQGGNIEQLIKYAAQKNIGLTLWYNSGGPHTTVTEQPRDIMNDPVKRKEEFKKLHEWGIKAVKVDFFNSDKQRLIQLYHGILEDAAKEKIMTIFHGCTLPRGWSRTYPNLLAMEGIRGAEQIGWDTVFANEAPMYNTINVFTRNVVGPMDYTPVTFSDTKCCPHTTTNAHELALSVLYESGMLHFADSDSSYRSQKEEVKKFMSDVPNTWDEIKFIKGEPGKDVVLARRSGSNWYIAGVNGENAEKKISINLSFLKNAIYSSTVFSDGNTPREINVNAVKYKSGDVVSLNMLPKGGFVISLIAAP